MYNGQQLAAAVGSSTWEAFLYGWWMPHAMQAVARYVCTTASLAWQYCCQCMQYMAVHDSHGTFWTYAAAIAISRLLSLGLLQFEKVSCTVAIWQLAGCAWHNRLHSYVEGALCILKALCQAQHGMPLQPWSGICTCNLQGSSI
jgi:hypothetical protein